jgi:hypothetical protein
MSRSSHRRTLRQMGSRRGDVVSRDQRNRSCVMYGVGRRQAPYRAARASRAPRRSQLLGRVTHGPAPGRLADRDPATSSRTHSQYGRAPAARRSAGAWRRPSRTAGAPAPIDDLPAAAVQHQLLLTEELTQVDDFCAQGDPLAEGVRFPCREAPGVQHSGRRPTSASLAVGFLGLATHHGTPGRGSSRNFPPSATTWECERPLGLQAFSLICFSSSAGSYC